MRKVELEGSPTAMGEAHGEALRVEIHELVERRKHILRSDFPTVTEDTLSGIGKRLVRNISEVAPDLYEEVCATSRAANIDEWALALGGGYTDFEDILTSMENSSEPTMGKECTITTVQLPDRRTLLVGTWDSHSSAEGYLTLIHRRPHLAPNTLALSTAGWPMQQGVSASGIAFAITNLSSNKTPRGDSVSYIAALPYLISSKDLATAKGILLKLSFAGGRYVLLCDRAGNSIGIETDGHSFAEVMGAIPHTNNYLSPSLKSSDNAGSYITASQIRQQSATRRFSNCANKQDIWNVLSFNDGSDASISREGSDEQSRTCAAFIIDPSTFSLEYSIGPPSLNGTRHVAHLEG